MVRAFVIDVGAKPCLLSLCSYGLITPFSFNGLRRKHTGVSLTTIRLEAGAWPSWPSFRLAVRNGTASLLGPTTLP